MILFVRVAQFSSGLSQGLLGYPVEGRFPGAGLTGSQVLPPIFVSFGRFLL